MKAFAKFALAASLCVVAEAAPAQEPVRGGILRQAVVAEPYTLDCHAATTVYVTSAMAPHYSTLVRYDPQNYPHVIGDLAQNWSVSDDGLTYTFKLHPNVKFHDGSPLTSKDVAVSLERIRKPPEGIVSARAPLFQRIKAIETPDEGTVIIRMNEREVALIELLANPLNCIYSAAKLAEDPRFPEKQVLGSGPFRFTGRVSGSSWEGVRYENFHRKGEPYLDGFKLFFMNGPAILNALQSDQVDAEFRSLTPQQRDRLAANRKDGVTVQAGTMATMIKIAFNTQRKPFDDVRVRRALNLAIDRVGGSEIISRVTFMGGVGGLQRPGYEFAETDEQIRQLPGFGPDIEARRTQARRLLQEAGVSNLSFSFGNRNVGEPYITIGTWVIDQWRKIGVSVKQDMLENPAWVAARANGTFDVLMDAIAEASDEPTVMFAKYVSRDKTPFNTAKYEDRELDELFSRQRSEINPEKRKEILHAMTRRVLEQSYYAPLFWANRIIVTNSKLKNWKITPSQFLNLDLASVWLEK
jgi:peptide/nickel transport system substrate-binding protein